MMTREQVERAKAMWEKAQQSTALARDCWMQLCQSRKVLIDRFRRAGFSYAEETDDFDKVMAEQARRFKQALDNMDNLSITLDELLQRLKTAHPGQSTQ